MVTNSTSRYQQVEDMANRLAERLQPSIACALRNALRCCPNCEHFDDGLYLCKLNNKRPPPTITAFGCELFKDNELPF